MKTNPLVEFPNLYKGKDIEKMTKKELIEALINMGNLYTKTLEDNLK